VTPEEAYKYARENEGSDKLSSICCQDPYYAYLYAIDIDESPREDTRIAACEDPLWAYWYSLEVDKGYHKETRRACYKTHDYYKLYLRDVLKSKYYEEIFLLQGIKRIKNDS